MDDRQLVHAFLSRGPYAVVGASNNRRKYGNKVLRCLLQHGRVAYPVNPRQHTIESQQCYADLSRLPEEVHGVSVVTPPPVTERIMEQIPACGARLVWMQPGAESAAAVHRAKALGLAVISGGPCLLVVLGFNDR